MLKKIIMTIVLCTIFGLQASSHYDLDDYDVESDYSSIDENDSLSSPLQTSALLTSQPAVATHVRFDDATEEALQAPLQFPLTARQLQAMKAKQAAAVMALAKIVEVGTFAEFRTQIAQLFIYQGGSYKNIELDTFLKEFHHVVELFAVDIQESMTLGLDAELKIHNQLKLDPACRQIEQYKIVGAVLPDRWFEIVDERSEEQREAIFNITKTRRIMLNKVKNYIDNNITQVRAKCIGSGLPTTTSKEVWEPGCCDVQMHRSCFKQCKHNNVAHCINPFCQTSETTLPSGEKEVKVYSKNWTPGFYQDVLDQKPAVRIKRIRDEACPVCMEDLKPEIPAILRPARKKTKRVDFQEQDPV